MAKKLALSIVVALLLAGCSKEPQPVEPVADIEAGKQFVQQHCTGCHTIEGAGKTAEIPNLAGQPAAYLADAMHAYRDGRRHHMALQELISGFSEKNVRDIAGYFASLPLVEQSTVAPAKADTYKQGEEAAAVCTDCHGERGFSTTPGVPSLAGQHPAYLIVSTQEYVNGSRGHAGAAEMMRDLNDVDIEKIAMYFASQVPEQRDPPPFGNAEAGEPLTAVCGGCHGERGVSQDPMIPILAGQEPTYLVNAIKAYRDHKRSHEDMVTDKSDEEIEDIAAFYSVQTVGSSNENGGELEDVIAKCERCHGQAAGQSTMVVPELRGQKKDYLFRVMKEYRDMKRGNSMMHKMSAGYSDVLLDEIADYYAAQPSQ